VHYRTNKVIQSHRKPLSKRGGFYLFICPRKLGWNREVKR